MNQIFSRHQPVKAFTLRVLHRRKWTADGCKYSLLVLRMAHRYLLRTVIFHQSVHLLQSSFVPLGDVHVQGVVAARLAVGPLSPLLESSHQTGPGLWQHMVN